MFHVFQFHGRPPRSSGPQTAVLIDGRRGWHGAARWWAISFLVASTGGLGRAELAKGTAGEALRLLRVNCASCHSAEKLKGGLNLSSRDGMMKGGDEGPVVVEGKPEKAP